MGVGGEAKTGEGGRRRQVVEGGGDSRRGGQMDIRSCDQILKRKHLV